MDFVENPHLLRSEYENGNPDVLPPRQGSSTIRQASNSYSDSPATSYQQQHIQERAISKTFSIHGMFPCDALVAQGFIENIPLDIDSGEKMLNMFRKDGKIAGKIRFQICRATSSLDMKLWVKGNGHLLLSCSVSREILSRIVHVSRPLSHSNYDFVAEKLLLKPAPLLEWHVNEVERTQVQIEEDSYVFDDEKKLEQLKQELRHTQNELKKARRDNVKLSQEPNRHIISLKAEICNLKEKLLQQTNELKACHNQVLELKGNIRVFCRCRPLTPNESKSGDSSVIEFNMVHNHELYVHTHDGGKRTFKFDRVFTPSHSQEEVFLETAPLVVSVLDGFNVCIFAYGQTGTGKTFTMEGTEDNRGVNYRTLEKLFQLASQRKGQYTYEIFVSVLEVYNEEIRDLLTAPPTLGHNNKKLEIKQVAEGMHHVPGAVEAPVHSIEEVWKILQTGSRARAVGSTNANKHSSRSHCLLCIMVKGENLMTGEITKSKLWLIDLAGSERIGKTDVHGERLKEAQNINKSLSALGDVIHSLTSKSSHIPYRNSKITHLLQDSLGGQSKTLMFVHISPSEQDVGETLCSLNFASRVRGVELGAARKQLDPAELVKYKKMVERAKEDGLKKDAIILELQTAAKVKEQTCKALSVKVKENEGLLEVERKARVAAEEKLREQSTIIDKQRLTIQKLSTELKAKQSGGLPEALEQQKISSTSTPSRPPLQERVMDNREPTATQQTRKRAAEDYVQKENVCNEAGTLPVKKHPRRVSLSMLQRQVPSTPAAIPLPKKRAAMQEDTTEELLRARRRGRASICVLPQRSSQWDVRTAPISPSVKLREACIRRPMACPSNPALLEGESMQATATRGRSSIAVPQRIHLRSPNLPQSVVTGEVDMTCNGGARRVGNFNNVNVIRGKPPQHPHQAVNRELQYQPKRLIGQNGDEVDHQPLNKLRRVSALPNPILCNWELPPAPSTPAHAHAPLAPLLPGGSIQSQPHLTHQRMTLTGRFSMVPSLLPPTPAQPMLGGALRVPLSDRNSGFSREQVWHR